MSINNPQTNSEFYQIPDASKFILAEKQSLTSEVNNPNFVDKYSAFKKTTKSKQESGKAEQINLKKLTDEQIEKTALILELYLGIKMSKDEIKKAVESIKTKVWLSSDDTSKLGLNKLFTNINMIGQTALTWPAVLSILARTGVESNPVTKALALALTSGFYFSSNNLIHKLAKEPLTGSQKDKVDQFRNTILSLAAIYGISTGLSVTGGKYIDSVMFSPEQKIENMIVSADNIKAVKDMYQAKVSGNREVLKNNAEYNTLATSLIEKQAKIAEIKVEIQKLEADKIIAIKSETKEQIAAREAQISVKRGSINDTYLNANGEKVNSPLPAEIREIQKRQNEIENGVNIDSSNTTSNTTTRTSLQESKEIVEKLSLLENNTSQAFTTAKLDGQELSPYEFNKSMLKLLAKQKGINPEHLDDLVIKKNLSAEEMDLIANDKEKNNSFNNLLVILMALPEGALTVGTALKLARNRKILDKDYQRGFERLGQTYSSELARLQFDGVNTGKPLPNKINPVDEELQVAYLAKETILNQISNSSEFLLAMQIIASQESGSLGKEMVSFRESFELQKSVPSDSENNLGSSIKSAWNRTGDRLSQFGTNIGERYSKHNESKTESNIVNMRKELVRSFKFSTQKAQLSTNIPDLLDNLESAVSIMTNDSGIEFDIEFITQEMDPITSIITIAPELTKSGIKKDLVHKVLVQLIKHSQVNKGKIYTIENLVETISSIQFITSKEAAIIAESINNPKDKIEKAKKLEQIELIKTVEKRLNQIILEIGDQSSISNLNVKNNFITTEIKDLIQIIERSNLDSNVIIKVLKANLNDFMSLELDTIYSDPSIYVSTACELIKSIVKGMQAGDIFYIENLPLFASIKAVTDENTKIRHEAIAEFLNKETPRSSDTKSLVKTVVGEREEKLFDLIAQLSDNAKNYSKNESIVISDFVDLINSNQSLTKENNPIRNLSSILNEDDLNLVNNIIQIKY